MLSSDLATSKSPLEAWASIGFSTMSAAMEIAAGATAATMSLCNSAMKPAVRSAMPVRQARAENTSPVGPRVDNTPRLIAPADLHGSAGKSWYRAPYRSPFDPMFWMMPGHPVDHVGDWLAPFVAVASSQLISARPTLLPPTMQLGPIAKDPWSVWLDTLAAMGRVGAPTVSIADTHLGDFNATYAAYRTAGGHAAAQVGRAMQSAMPPLGLAAHADTTPPWPWLLPFAFYGWPPR